MFWGKRTARNPCVHHSQDVCLDNPTTLTNNTKRRGVSQEYIALPVLS